MKLSEAMRLGSMLRPQAFGTLFNTRAGTSCAMGAACEAVGLLDTAQDNAFVMDREKREATDWLPLMQLPMECPLCGTAWSPSFSHIREVQGVIVHLNNDHRWTRERIADWIEGLEAAQAHVAAVVLAQKASQ